MCSMPPYTLLVEVKTMTGSRPVRRAASKTLRVPSAFTSKSERGSVIDVVTAHLPGQVIDHIGVFDDGLYGFKITDIASDDPKLSALVLRGQPSGVLMRAAPQEGIENRDLEAFAEK